MCIRDRLSLAHFWRPCGIVLRLALEDLSAGLLVESVGTRDASAHLGGSGSSGILSWMD